MTIKYLCRTKQISIIRMSFGKLTAQFIFKALYKNKLINPPTLCMIKWKYCYPSFLWLFINLVVFEYLLVWMCFGSYLMCSSVIYCCTLGDPSDDVTLSEKRLSQTELTSHCSRTHLWLSEVVNKLELLRGPWVPISKQIPTMHFSLTGKGKS